MPLLAPEVPATMLLRQTGLAKLAGRWDPRERGWPGGAEAKPLAEAKPAVEPPSCDNGWNPDPGRPGDK